MNADSNVAARVTSAAVSSPEPSGAVTSRITALASWDRTSIWRAAASASSVPWRSSGSLIASAMRVVASKIGSIIAV